MIRLAIAALLILVSACRHDMRWQAKENAYSSRMTGPAKIPMDTVQYRQQRPAAPPVSMALLLRGQERFRIFCTPCHSELGDGHGMIVQRGFPAPPAYTIPRLRNAPPQLFYDVMTNGFGAMYSYAQRVPPDDRWAIAAYIRALQISQDSKLADLTPAEQAALK